jgi:hypothetical protein
MKKINPRQNGIKTFVFLVLICALFLQACDIESPYLDVIGQKIANDTSDDVELANLTLSTGILFPAFSRDVTQYYVSLYSTTASITVTAATSFPYAGLTINGTTVSSEAPSVDINLNPGHNGLLIEVTSSSGAATQEYKISVCRAVVDLPKTGQTISYGDEDDGALREGIARPTPRFTDNGDATVTDNLTGLMWVEIPIATTSDWKQTLYDVDTLIRGGHSDWRLPNRCELRSLFNYNFENPAFWLNALEFSDVLASFYWSSTTCQPLTDRAWAVSMGVGFVEYAGKTASFDIFPVRTGETSGIIQIPKTGQTESFYSGDDGEYEYGVSWPNPRFTDNGNGTITDNLTGLMWGETSSPNAGLWADALTYANDLSLGGFEDWHLPNINELESLFNAGTDDMSAWLEAQGFEDIPSGVYWSSTTYAGMVGTSAWFLYMDPNWQWGYHWHQDKDHVGGYYFGDGYSLSVRSGR